MTNRDAEIANAILTGNNTVILHQLYVTAYPGIQKFILKNSGDKEEAKDIFQDAVIALFGIIKSGKYDPSKPIDGFLYHAARNLWINRIKKKDRQRPLKVIDTESWENDETPLRYLVEVEKMNTIRQLMEKIGNPCKELMRHVLYDKLSMKEVAQKMGFSNEDTAKSTHYACKKKLAMLIYQNKETLTLLRG